MFTIDNNIAHREIKTLMRQGKNLDIRIDESFALISTHAVTGLQYMLTPDNWQWLLNYLRTGDYEDFGIFPSDTSKSFTALEHLKELIESRCNIARIPFLRETQAFVKLRGLFKFGKLFFCIRRSDEFMDYLNDNGL